MLTPQELDALDENPPASQGRSLAGKILMPEELDRLDQGEPSISERFDQLPENGPLPSTASIREVDNTLPDMQATTRGGGRVPIQGGGSMLDDAEGPIERALTAAPGTAARAVGYAGRSLRAGVADIASLARGEPAENLATLGTDIMMGGKRGPLSVIGGTGKPSELPIEQQIKEAALDKAEQGKLPWEAMMASAAQQLTGDLPKFAATAGVGGGTLAQSIAAGGVFGMDDEGAFHPKQAAIMALLPGVGKLARMGTASIVGRAAEAGFKGMENPIVQKVVEEVGHQAGLDAYMTLSSAPELIQQYQDDPKMAMASVANIVFQNLGFALLGAERFRKGVPSDTRMWIQEKADAMAEDIIKSRIAQDYTGEELKDIYQRVNSSDPSATDSEKNLVSFINSQMGKGQKGLFKSGARVTTTEYDVGSLPKFWQKYVPKATATLEPLGAEQATTTPAATVPPKGRSLRLLLPEELDATDTEQQPGSVPPKPGGTKPVGETKPTAKPSDSVPSATGKPPAAEVPKPVPPAAPEAKPAVEIPHPIVGKTVTVTRKLTTSSKPQQVPTKVVSVREGAPTRTGKRTIEVALESGESATVQIEHAGQPDEPINSAVERALKMLNATVPAEKPEAPPAGPKPEVAKLATGDHLNPLGHPFGTTYHATPEDWKEWQRLVALPVHKDGNIDQEVFAQREALKNKYGGMPPEPPKGTKETKPLIPVRPPAPTPEPASNGLPKGWTKEDIAHIYDEVAAGKKVLVADEALGIPTIHDALLTNAEHKGYGMFVKKGDGWEVSFDAGGAMSRTPSGQGFTRVGERQGKFPYDFEAVKARLKALLDAPAPKPESTLPRQAGDLEGLTEAELDAMLDSAATPSDGVPDGTQVLHFTKRNGVWTYTETGGPVTDPGLAAQLEERAKNKPPTPTKWREIGTNKAGETVVEFGPQRGVIRGGKPVWEPEATEESVRVEKWFSQTSPEPPRPGEKTAADIAADAARAGVKGINEAVKGLHDLFGGGAHMGSGGPSFDEETYQKAKPHFESAYEQFKQAGKSLQDFMRFIFEKFGANVRLYLKRFIQELQMGKAGVKVTLGADKPTESPNGNRQPGGGSPPTTGETGEGGETGTAPEGETSGVQPGTGKAPKGGRPPGRAPSGGESSTDADGVPPEQGSTPPESGTGTGGEGSTGEVPGKPSEANPAPIPEVGESGPLNYRLPLDVAPTGAVARIRANIDAISLVRQLEKEDRFPTDEERAILAKWTGWGSFKEMFNEGRAERRDYDPGWVKRYGQYYDKLKKLLTPAEFNAAVESTVNAHYTGPDVVIPMWELAKQLGFKGGRTLESSAGAGNFNGFQPEELAKATIWTMIEMEPLTGKIMSYLYPKSDNRIQAFEDTKLPNGFYEMGIGNVPFHETGPGKEYPDLNLHNYFLARMLDKVKPGGIVLAITSGYTMDGRPEQRRFLGTKGQLVGAIRLPNNAFKDSAGTEVVTDILILRKPDGKPFNAEKWENTLPIDIGEELTRVEDKPRINEYFVNHPEMVLGKHALTGTMYKKNSYTVTGTGDLMAKLREAFTKLPRDIFQQGAQQSDLAVTQTGLEDYTVVLDDKGRVMEAHGFKLELPEWDSSSATLVKRAKDYISLRDVLMGQYALERHPESTDADIEANRKKLVSLYKSWVKKHGTLNLNPRVSGFLDKDPGYFPVMGLEDVREVEDPKDPSKTVTVIDMADVLKQRVLHPDLPPSHVETATEALGVSMAYKASMDLDFIKAITGLDDEQIEAELITNNLAFKDPESGRLVTSNDYLSGDVRDKLAKAIFAAKESNTFARNVEALRTAIPEDKPFEQIAVSINARWTPIAVLNNFAVNIIGLTPGAVTLTPVVDEFQVKDMERYEISDKARTEWSMKAMNADRLLQHALNFKRVEIRVRTDEDKYIVDEDATALGNQIVDRMKEAFTDYIRTSKDKVQYRYFDSKRGEYITDQLPIWDAMEREFNKRHNSFVEPKYDGSILKLPGLSDLVRRNPHLLNGVMRAIMSGACVYAHGTGSGKTFLIIVGAHELRRIGLAKKQVIVVKKPTVTQYRVSIERAYPGSRVLIATEKDFKPANRKKLIGRIASGNWDFIVLTHEQFKAVKTSEQQVRDFYEEQLEQLRQILRDKGQASAENAKSTRGMESSVRNIVKKLKALKKSMDKHIASLAKHQDKGAMSWGDLGVDGLWVDESHNFKKMPLPTQMDADIKGIPNSFSQRAVDLLIKVRDVQQKTSGRNVFFASGTPVSNTLAELWVQFHATNPNLLKAFSVGTFDSFASTFADVVENFEFGWDNRFHDVIRMARFKNPVALTMLTRLGMDVRIGNKELGLDVPELEGGKPTVKIVKPTKAFTRWIDLLSRAVRVWDNLEPKERYFASWIPITLMRAGVAAALDPRCLFADAEDDPNSKVNTAVRDIIEEWQKGKEKRTTMMVFADMYRTMNTSKLDDFLGGGFRSHGEIDEVPEPTGTGDDEAADDAGDTSAKDEGDYVKNAVGAFNLYNDIRAKLVAAGIPEHEIGIITEHETDAKRDALFNKVRSGQVRILIGSTEKIGEGVDVPQRMSAQFHLDPPMQMTPAKLEQRLGRLIRQGNLHSPKNWNLPVRAFLYAMERSMDAAIYQMLQYKAEMIIQALKGMFLGDSFEDPASELSMAMAEMKAAATGDKRVLQLAVLKKEVRDLSLRFGAYQRRMSELRREIDYAERSVRDETAGALNYRRLGAAVTAATADKENLTLLHVKSQKRVSGTKEVKAWLKSLDDTMLEAVKVPETSREASLIFGDNVRVRVTMRHDLEAQWGSDGKRTDSKSVINRSATFYLGGPEPDRENPMWSTNPSNMETLVQTLLGIPVHAEERAVKQMEEAAKAESLAAGYNQQFNATRFDDMELLNQKRAELDGLENQLRQASDPWGAIRSEAAQVSPPLHLRIISEMQRLQPQLDQMSDNYERLKLRLGLTTAEGDGEEWEREYLPDAVEKARQDMINGELRMHDLQRRLATVEKARLGSAKAGALANLPFGRTPNRMGKSYDIEAPEPASPGALEMSAQGIEQIMAMLHNPYNGLSNRARALALDLLSQPVMRSLDWSKLTVSIQDQINMARKGTMSTAGEGFSGSADVSRWLMELAKGARPQTFPHEVFHFLYEMLPQGDKDRITQLRLEAMDSLVTGLPPGPSKDAIMAFLKASHGGMTSTAFVSLWNRIAEEFPGADLEQLRRQAYALINNTEFTAHMGSDEFSRAHGERMAKEGWLAGLVGRVKAWLMGLLDSLRRLFHAKPSMEQLIREMLAGKNLSNPEGGVISEKSGALDEREDATPPEESGVGAADMEMTEEMGKALEGSSPKKTEVLGRIDTILGRPGLGDAERAQGTAYAAGVLAKAGLQITQDTDTGLWKLADEGFDAEIEGRKLLTLLQKEIEGQNQPGKQSGWLGNLLNSVVVNMTPDRITAFSPQLKQELYAVAQGERSQRGIMLASLGGLPKTLQYVARNVNVVLHKTYSDAFGGDFIRSVLGRITTEFRHYFTEAELDAIVKENAKLKDFLDKTLAMNRREEGGRVYRRAQGMLKEKGLKTLSTLEADARISEAVTSIIEQLKKQGIEPKPNPNKPLPPLHRLLLMVHPATAEKIDRLIAKAITDAMRNAGIKQALIEAEDDEERSELSDRFSAGEEPTDEQQESGLELPEFIHWKILRDNLLGYNPVTLKLTQDLIRNDFSGVSFNKKPAVRKVDTKIDLNALAKAPEAEVQRVIEGYLTNLEANMDMSSAADDTKQRILGVVEKQVTDQLEQARARVREPMFQPPKDKRAQLTPDQRIGQLINAGLLGDARLDARELVERVAAKSPVQKLTPKIPDLVRQALEIPFYRQGEIGEHFANALVQRLGISVDDAGKAQELFGEAFNQKFRVARERAAKHARESLTPAERKEAGPRQALWEKIVQATNAGIFDTGEVLREIARAHGWTPPTDAEVRKLHDLAEQIQRLMDLNPSERAQAGEDPKDIAEALMIKRAATSSRRIALKHQIETIWSKMVRPISFRHYWGTRQNIAAALNEFEVANLLLKIGFPFRLAVHITTQLCVHTPTRGIAEGIIRHQEDKAAGRETHLWRDISGSLGQAYKDTLKSIVPALQAARSALAGRAESRNVDRLLSGVQAIDRMSLKADELALKGDHVRAGILRTLALVRMSLRVTQALDNFQGTPAEAQEMRAIVITALRENGRSPAEAEVVADQIIGRANDEMPVAVAEVSAAFQANGIIAKPIELQEAARELVKQRQYARMAELGLPADDFQARIRLLRRTISWQERTSTGPGGVVAAAGRAASAVLAHAGLPLSFTRFANAFGTGLNYLLMFTPLYGLANAHLPGSKPSPWFQTETDRMQRRVQALLGTLIGGALFALAAAGHIVVRLKWPTDRKERELLQASGHRLGTIEIYTGDGEFIAFSLSVGPFSLLAPYLAAGGALNEVLVRREREQAKMNAEAEALGLQAGKIRPMNGADLLGVALAGAERTLMGGKSAVGLSASVSEYGIPNSRKAVAAYVSPLIPTLPALQEVSRMMGVDLDAKLATVWDYMLPLPTSQARAVNVLGDPVGTPDAVQRVVQTITAGTYPAVIDEKAAKDRDGYAALFNSGWLPPAIEPGKGYAIGGEFRPMTDAELEQYTVARGTLLKQALAGNPTADATAVKAAYQGANQEALAQIGAMVPPTASGSSQGQGAGSISPFAPAAPRSTPTFASLPGAGTVASPRGSTAGRPAPMRRIGSLRRVRVSRPSGKIRGPSLRRPAPFRAPARSGGGFKGGARSLRPRFR